MYIHISQRFIGGCARRIDLYLILELQLVMFETAFSLLICYRFYFLWSISYGCDVRLDEGNYDKPIGDGGGYLKKSFVVLRSEEEIRNANSLLNMLFNRIRLTNANLSLSKFCFSNGDNISLGLTNVKNGTSRDYVNCSSC